LYLIGFMLLVCSEVGIMGSAGERPGASWNEKLVVPGGIS
jgi:hypothetical protein